MIIDEEEKECPKEDQEEVEMKKRDNEVLLARAKQMAESAPAKVINDEHYLMSRLEYKIYRDQECGSGDYSKYFKAKSSDGALIAVRISPLAQVPKMYRDHFKTTSVKVIRLLSTLKHENVIHFVDIFIASSKMYVFCEYVDGYNLEAVCSKRQYNEEEIKFWSHSIFNGLAFLYESAIGHRNICASNILMTADTKVVKITGFGRSMITYDHIRNQEILSPVEEFYAYHLAPETQIGPYDAHAADIWGGGIVVINLLTSKYPFKKNTTNHTECFKIHFRRQLIELSSELDDMLTKIFDEPSARLNAYGVLGHPWLCS
jgi:chromosome undetermined scaffold_16, whole genome shotgun sequence